jgi:hypothetical protein
MRSSDNISIEESSTLPDSPATGHQNLSDPPDQAMFDLRHREKTSVSMPRQHRIYSQIPLRKTQRNAAELDL